ncbi:MAG: multidrug effflux MFS transporter [Devosiaceae bacterium]|nr:multidrug effflux MFS transporter [Devosiaceae bacterium MH13]
MAQSSPDASPATGQPSRAEFVVLAAGLMSLVAMSVDLMLPAFGEISDHFALANPNDRQAMITVVFAGLMVGQVFFGPLSDYVGRKPAIVIGLATHIVGSLICMFASDYTALLLGRFLQGFGGAAARIVIVAMVRDRFVGQAMGQIMSVVLTVFILVPVFAPAIGQAMLLVLPWPALFGYLAIHALVAGVWLFARQPETHTERQRFDARNLLASALIVLRTPVAMIYAIAAGCAFGTLLGYIVSSQQILQDLYGTGSAFALYFGLTAGFVALATIANAWLLGRYTMELVTGVAIGIQMAWSALFLLFLLVSDPIPPLWLWMIFITVTLFLVGMTFGNYNAIALRPLGKIAGIASSVTASLQTLFSMVVATLIGASFDMNVLPVVIGSLVMAMLGSLLMVLGRRVSAQSTASGS